LTEDYLIARGTSMLAQLQTFSLLGIEALPVEVEVDLSSATLPKTILVGLPEQAVKESTHRVERAIVNAGYRLPHDRLVINLAPAELPKQASSFDLPISLGILAVSNQLQSSLLGQYAAVGELSLEVEDPIPLERFAGCAATGAFIFVDTATLRTAAVGLVAA